MPVEDLIRSQLQSEQEAPWATTTRANSEDYIALQKVMALCELHRSDTFDWYDNH